MKRKNEKSARLSDIKGLLSREELKKVVGGYYQCWCVFGRDPGCSDPCCIMIGKFC